MYGSTAYAEAPIASLPMVGAGEVVTTIGTRGTDSVTVDAVTGSGPYTVDLSSAAASTTLVGDTLTDFGMNDYLITAIASDILTVSDVLGAGTAPVTGAGTTGRTYSTISLWEADLDDTDLYAFNDNAEGHACSDAAFDETVTINGGTTVSLASVTLTSPSGERHDGTAGTGARNTVTSGQAFVMGRDDLTISWIEAQGNAAASGDIRIIDGSDATLTGRVVHHCLIHDQDRSSGWAFGVDIRVTSVLVGTVSIHNNIVYDIRTTSSTASHTAQGIIALSDTDEVVYIYNNTVDRIVNNNSTGDCGGINNSDAEGVLVKNNAVFDVGGDSSGTLEDYVINSPSSASMTHNLSSDATASGTGALTSKTAANNVTSNTDGSEDYHLIGGADAFEVGTDLGTTPDDVELDIDAFDRDAGGSTWSMSSDQGASLVTMVTQTDTASLSDSVSTTLIGPGTISVASTIAMSDVVTWTAEGNLFKHLSDTLSMRTKLKRFDVIFRRAPSTTLGMSDNVTRVADVFRAVIETLGLNDDNPIVTPPTHMIPIVTDTVDVDVDRSIDVDHFRSVLTTMGLVDSWSNVLNPEYRIRQFSKMSFTDVVSGLTPKQRVIIDNLGMSDAVAMLVDFYSRTIIENLGLIQNRDDEVNLDVTVKRAIANTIYTSDDVLKDVAVFRALTDTLSAADSVAMAPIWQRVLDSTLAASTGLTALYYTVLLVTENMSLSDSLSLFMLAPRTITDSMGYSDAVSRDADLNRAMASTFGVSDLVMSQASLERLISDSAGLSDAIDRAVTAKRDASSTMSGADAVSRDVDVDRAISENLGMSDALSSFLLASVNVASTLGINTQVDRDAAVKRVISSIVGISDNVLRDVDVFRQVDSTIGASDDVQRVHAAMRSISDSLGVSDSVTIPRPEGQAVWILPTRGTIYVLDERGTLWELDTRGTTWDLDDR